MTTIEQILQMPDSDIAKSGIIVKQIFEEYRKVSGQFPQFCDCQLKKYLRYLRKHYGTN